MRNLLIVLLPASLTLAACGYKGPLYVPGPKAAPTSTPAAPAAEPAPDRPVPAQSAPPPQ